MMSDIGLVVLLLKGHFTCENAIIDFFAVNPSRLTKFYNRSS